MHNMHYATMNGFDFYIEVKDYVDRILVYGPQGLACEMTPAPEVPDREGKIFNGTLPRKFLGEDLILRLLAGEGTAEFKTKDILSVPVNGTGIGSDNFIVVNDISGESKVCFIEFHRRVSEGFGIPLEIELERKEQGKLKSEWKCKNADLHARGVDPQAVNYISAIQLSMSDVRTQQIVEELNNEQNIIKLYSAESRVSYKIEQ